jgi:glucose-1-phosphate adenylyltransferase
MSTKLAAMILAGGKGTRLQALTKKVAKPAVSYGGKYRIIDFPLSNCANSGITCVGVLTQYESSELNTYVGNGEKWGLNGVRSLTSVLTPKQTDEGSNWYLGTADAIYQNIDWLDRVEPEYVLILSGDHVYSCSYDAMLKKTVDENADCTIAVYPVSWEEASRFGILVTDKTTTSPTSKKNRRSRFRIWPRWVFISSHIRFCARNSSPMPRILFRARFRQEHHPKMMAEKKKMVAYTYHGYWKDVGTVASLHQANMDLLLTGDSSTNLYTVQGDNRIYSEDTHSARNTLARKPN